LACAC
jgi:DNA-binding transcriptional LysR family regulator